jgi:hypothetical protein
MRMGFKHAARVVTLVEGEAPAIMAKSTGLELIKLPTVFGLLRPDIALNVGNCFEIMDTTTTDACMNIRWCRLWVRGVGHR